jgi:hypothetical protein
VGRPVTDEERAVEERRRLHREKWEWGGRLPSETLRGIRDSNVLGLLRYDTDLVHALDAAGPEAQRAVALLAARRASEAAGLTDVAWVAQALTDLAEGRPPASPFDDAALMWETLRSDPAVPDRSVLGAMPPERPPYIPPPPEAFGWTWFPEAEPSDNQSSSPEHGRLMGRWVRTAPGGARRTPSATHEIVVVQHPIGTPYTPGRISQPHFALPAVLAAAGTRPLKAAVDAVWHALNTYGEHYPELLEEIRTACAERAAE